MPTFLSCFASSTTSPSGFEVTSCWDCSPSKSTWTTSDGSSFPREFPMGAATGAPKQPTETCRFLEEGPGAG
eukprot:CAMPEP_0194777118 /NCGR_PEP_ID=MMETSP0323_2-20130528/64820_1 /TAXON_ID=2866 ORGANISM="Crypthecodinium cohnii, Strain Seligo" /NCGR_SAMPLE_ID=MMETSP0323_2 /ASSEMBLY_ACC=CAM_ASM_000346 /LENGTH=71 /DNA_ID=CAMNT_0039713797 /DNA_START=85 /DNA_END=297 /DNA_ORIENTATION=-